MSLRRLIAPILLFLLPVSISVSHAHAQQAAGTTPLGSPTILRLCNPQCQTLTWKGDHYDSAKDGDPSTIATYTVEQWSPSGIRLKGRSLLAFDAGKQNVPFVNVPVSRKDHIEVTLTGVIAGDGKSIDEAIMKWHFGAKGGEASYQLTWDTQSASFGPAACAEQSSLPSVPTALEICESNCILKNNGNIGTWLFNGKNGTGSWPLGQRANLYVKEWDSQKIIITRQDVPTSVNAGLTATYVGTACGNNIKGDLMVDWPGHPDSNKTWPWSATIPSTGCEGIGDDPLRLKEQAKEAMRFRQLPSAFSCLLHAANLGDMEARTATGLMYRDGIGTKTDYAEALSLFQKSAIQRDYNAELALSEMYDLGLGMKRDPDQAKFWQGKAYNNPAQVAMRQQRQDQQAAQQLLFMGLCAVVESMSRPDVYVVR